MKLDPGEILTRVVEADASDLHLTVGAPPMVRIDGMLYELGTGRLDSTQTREFAYAVMTGHQRQRLENDLQVDFSYMLPGKARFRVNAYFQRGAVSVAMRLIPNEIKSVTDLGLPDTVRDFAYKARGLVLVTGPTGSGKTTTLAAVLDEVNSNRHDHIITIEDPIEFMHPHRSCIVDQREIGADTETFALALRAALRQDPDVILVGEMRDLETISTALTAAETGHLVLATLHTQDAAQTIDRVVDVFPPHQQQQVRVQLAGALQGIVVQQLLPRASGRGRVVACEVLVATPAIRNLVREGKTHQIHSSIQTGAAHGMQTMDAALAELVRSGTISVDLAVSRAHSAGELRRLVGRSVEAV